LVVTPCSLLPLSLLVHLSLSLLVHLSLLLIFVIPLTIRRWSLRPGTIQSRISGTLPDNFILIPCGSDKAGVRLLLLLTWRVRVGYPAVGVGGVQAVVSRFALEADIRAGHVAGIVGILLGSCYPLVLWQLWGVESPSILMRWQAGGFGRGGAGVKLHGSELRLSDPHLLKTKITDAFRRFVDSVLGPIISVIWRSTIARRCLFQRHLFEHQLAQLPNDAHLLAQLFETSKFER